MAGEQLGEALTGSYSVPGGEARLYERGATINGSGGEVVVWFDFPMIGRPHIAVGDSASASIFENVGFTFQPAPAWSLARLEPMIRNALAGRLGLLPTGQTSSPSIMLIGPAEVVLEPAGGTAPTWYGLRATASLQERQLYDIAVLLDGGQWKVVAPHAVYYRSTWSDFGIAHITDLHVARRIDYFPGRLEGLGRSEATRKMYNWNDRFRGFIRYANYLHGIGVLDVILATGDIFDYIFEDDDDENGGGNALFARHLILGQWPGPQFPDVEELRVPIFMVPGNHDYRKFPYRMLFDLDIGIASVKQIQNHYGYHLLWRDALALSRGDNGDDVPKLSADSAAKMVEVDAENASYSTHLADLRSYIIRLGKHRIAMLDSKWDVGVVTSKLDGLRTWLGWASEDERTFVGGSPNSEGVSDSELGLVSQALEGTPEGGLFILGLHSPLFNVWDNEYPYFLRETQRPALPQQVVAFLARHDKPFPLPPGAHPSWFPPSEDQGAPTYVKRGDTDDRLDYGVSRGKAEDLIRLLAGVGSSRPADLVLHGHTHRHNEFRIGTVGGELAFYMDFYTQNPAHYYPMRFDTGEDDVTYVDVIEGAPANATHSVMPYDAMYKYVVQVPPYPKPLASAPDPRSWWVEHRPLVLQTGALGPLENSQVSFSGFRVVSVKGDVIDKIHHVSIEKLHASDYRLPWEDAVRPEAPRRHLRSQRSLEYGAPEAEGVPFGYVVPSNGLQNIIYRDTAGHLIELWRDTAGASGFGDLTQAADNAIPAAGDPFVYIDTVEGLQIILYRGTDGNVHSLYFSTEVAGHDNLSGSIGAPHAAGNPVGYLNTSNNTHHVVYRGNDRHIHVLWWTGQDAVHHEVATSADGAVLAVGDPAAYFDPVRGDNIVVYRGVDDHIHDLYWSTGDIGHDDASGFAGSPPAAGDPVAYKTAFNDSHQVTYRSGDGHLHELWWVGTEPVIPWDLTAEAGAPAAVSDPIAYYSANTNTKHVFYRTEDGHLNEIWWVPGGGTPAHVDLSLAALAPPSADKPTGFDGPAYLHVAYRGTDNQIHEIRWA